MIDHLLWCRMETLKKHLPTSVPEGLNELRKIAIRFEEKIYTAATNQVLLMFPFVDREMFPRNYSSRH